MIADLISDDDLAQVRSLPEIHRDPGRRGSIRLQPLKRSDFAGLENLRSLAGATLGNSEWPSVLETLHDLKDLHLTLLGPADAFLLPSNAFLGLDSLEIMTINEHTNSYLIFAPNVFKGLDNLRVLDMGVGTFSFNNCGDAVDSSCAGSLCTQSRMQSDWLTLEMLEDLPMLDTLIVCTDRVAEISPDVMNTLIERRVKPFAN